MTIEMLEAYASFFGPVLIVGYFVLKALDDRNYSDSFQMILVAVAITCFVLMARRTALPITSQSEYIDLVFTGFLVSICSAVVGYVIALLLIGIGKVLGFAERKAGVRGARTDPLLECGNCGNTQEVANCNIRSDTSFYMVERVVGYSSDEEDLFPLICFKCEQYAPFKWTPQGDIEYYRTKPLDEEVCVAAKGYALEQGDMHAVRKIDGTKAGRKLEAKFKPLLGETDSATSSSRSAEKKEEKSGMGFFGELLALSATLICYLVTWKLYEYILSKSIKSISSGEIVWAYIGAAASVWATLFWLLKDENEKALADLFLVLVTPLFYALTAYLSFELLNVFQWGYLVALIGIVAGSCGLTVFSYLFFRDLFRATFGLSATKPNTNNALGVDQEEDPEDWLFLLAFFGGLLAPVFYFTDQWDDSGDWVFLLIAVLSAIPSGLLCAAGLSWVVSVWRKIRAFFLD